MLNRYIIIDAANPESDIIIVRKICSTGINLFGNIFKNSDNFAPFLFVMEKNSELEKWYFDNCWGKYVSIIIFSVDKPKKIQSKLSKILSVTIESKGDFYFRYYDPRVLAVFLPTCNEQQLSIIFSSVDVFICEESNDTNAKIFSIDKTGKLFTNNIVKDELIEFTPEIKKKRIRFF